MPELTCEVGTRADSRNTVCIKRTIHQTMDKVEHTVGAIAAELITNISEICFAPVIVVEEKDMRKTVLIYFVSAKGVINSLTFISFLST